MTTLPPEPAPRPTPELHRLRAVAESFGTDPARYDRARPPYPDALVRRIAGTASGTDVLDVGCGTGIEGRQFRRAGCTVLGVEPDPRMAEFARRTGVEVEVAAFEEWEPAGREFDAVVAGTAWHWVDPAAGAAKAARVLRPGGLLAPFWHIFEPPAEVNDAFAAAYRRVAPDSPFNNKQSQRPRNGPGRTAVDGYQPLLAKAADGIRGVDGFGEPEQWRYDWERRYTREEWLDQLPTTGALTRLAPEKLAEVLADVGAAVDALGGAFTMKYSTVAVTAIRV